MVLSFKTQREVRLVDAFTCYLAPPEILASRLSSPSCLVAVLWLWGQEEWEKRRLKRVEVMVVDDEGSYSVFVFISLIIFMSPLKVRKSPFKLTE